MPEADDKEIRSLNKDITYTARRVNEDFTQIEKWLEANEMAAHPGKTKVMMAESCPALNAAEDIEIYLKNHKLSDADSNKYQGVHVDSTLTWNYHLQYLCKRVYPKLRVFNRFSSFLSKRHTSVNLQANYPTNYG